MLYTRIYLKGAVQWKNILVVEAELDLNLACDLVHHIFGDA